MRRGTPALFGLIVLASCGGGSGVAPANRPPVAAALAANTPEDTALEGVLPAASDPDGDAISYQLTTPPEHGVAEIAPEGAFRYTPYRDFNGPDQFTFSVRDPRGGASAWQVSVMVAPVNDAPELAGPPFGIVRTRVGNDLTDIHDLLVQPDGKLVATGYARFAADDDFALLRYNADGSIDAQFGDAGVVITPVRLDDRGQGIAMQPDGKLLMTGSSGGGLDHDIHLLRYTTDGSLDGTFGDDGVVKVLTGTVESAASVLVQPDGGIVVAASGGGQGVLVARYDGNGSPDTSFGGGTGRVATPVGSLALARALALRPDGRLLVAGHVFVAGSTDILLLQLLPDGSPDPAFGGGDGIATLPVTAEGVDSAASVALLPDGRAALAGYAGSNPAFAMLLVNPDGSLSTAFGGDGIVTTRIGDCLNYGNDLAVQPDGRLVVAGVAYTCSGPWIVRRDMALLRYGLDGLPDATFGDGAGVVLTDRSGLIEAESRSVIVQADRKIVAAGRTRAGIAPVMALLRVLADGTPDVSFGHVPAIEFREGLAFSFSVPAGRFVDRDQDTLIYSARLAGGAPLPAWIGFNPATLVFSGIVPPGAGGQSWPIRLVATDPAGASTEDLFGFAPAP